MLTYRKVNSDYERNGTYKLRYNIYCLEKCWLDSNRYPSGEEKDEEDLSSEHFLAHNVNNDMLGAVRVILSSANCRLPIIDNFRVHIPEDGRKAVEVSRLVVKDVARGSEVVIGLFHAIYNWGLKNNITHAYAILEPKLLKYLQRMGYPFEVVSESKYYFGDITVAVCLIMENAREMFLNNRVKILEKYNIIEES